jgi:hypothetical protein
VTKPFNPVERSSVSCARCSAASVTTSAARSSPSCARCSNASSPRRAVWASGREKALRSSTGERTVWSWRRGEMSASSCRAAA